MEQIQLVMRLLTRNMILRNFMEMLRGEVLFLIKLLLKRKDESLDPQGED